MLQESVAALATVGLKHVEVTFDSSDAAVMIDAIRNRLPQVFVEAGTMKSVDQVHQAAEAGAQLVVSPHANIALAEASHDHGLAYVPGAFTPTEVMTAWSWKRPTRRAIPYRLHRTRVLAAVSWTVPRDSCIGDWRSSIGECRGVSPLGRDRS